MTFKSFKGCDTICGNSFHIGKIVTQPDWIGRSVFKYPLTKNRMKKQMMVQFLSDFGQ